ncbi:hypothetical protein [Acidovorax sp. sic0104]|uniref:hypothetical protein n=1 Tax=Acidovorax sp. sic0104 TaxID=2854784 RepID=UPI001C489170|nr:hypothetical protein [Acidovorax sp. sic0104]MBV7539571.1 hypothetical protein [Acidovorax sp. sic0104]
MNDFVASVFRLIVRLLVVAMGVVLFLSLLAAVMVLALAWVLRAGWARLTGKPVTPWVMRMDPRSGFSTAFRSTQRWSSAGAQRAPEPGDGAEAPVASRRGGILPGAAQVTDVEARDLR